MSASGDNVKPVAIIVLSFNTKEITMRCLKFLKLDTKYSDYDVIVIDNASTDGSKEALRTVPNITLVENPINVGVSKGWNQGILIAQEKFGDIEERYIMLLNSDTLVACGWLETLVKVMNSDEKIGIVSYGDMTNPNVFAQTEVENFSFIAPLIRGEVAKEVGFFDERLFLCYQDNLFCLRAKKRGWKIVATPENLCYHFGNRSAIQLPDMQKTIREDRVVYEALMAEEATDSL